MVKALQILSIKLSDPIPKSKKDMAIFETSIGAMMAWAVAGAASLLLAASQPSFHGLTEDERFICICIAGGIAGGLLFVSVFPKATIRGTAAKWLVSPVASGVFGPAVCEFYNLKSSIWYSLAASGSIGLFAWGILSFIVPIGPNIAKWFLNKWFPGIIEDDGAENNHRREDGDKDRQTESEKTLRDRSRRRGR